MELLALALALLVVWGVVGFAVATSFDRSLNMLHALLVAPSLGLACTVIPLFWLSFLGLPSRVVGIPLTILLLLTAGILLLKRRPALNLGMFMPVVFATALGLISVGWPAM